MEGFNWETQTVFPVQVRETQNWTKRDFSVILHLDLRRCPQGPACRANGPSTVPAGLPEMSRAEAWRQRPTLYSRLCRQHHGKTSRFHLGMKAKSRFICPLLALPFAFCQILRWVHPEIHLRWYQEVVYKSLPSPQASSTVHDTYVLSK